MPKLVSPWAASLLLRLAKYELAENRGARFLKLAEEARGRITHISAEEASVALQKRVLVIDVRERDEFARGHIPRSLHLARGTIEIDIERHAPNLDAEIITYCGHGNRSALAAESLQRMGYADVKSIKGGFQAWLDAGFPAWRGGESFEE